MNTLRNLGLFALVALLPVQDTTLQQTPMRNLGASLSTFPLLLLAGLWVAERLLTVNWTLPRRALYIAVYSAGISALYLVLWGTTLADGSLLVKSINLAIILGLYLFGVFGVRYTPNRWLRAGAMCGFALTLAALLTGPLLDGSALLHFTVNQDGRPRGFSSESSTFSVQAVISGLLAVYCARTSVMRFVFAGSTVALLVYSGSKGGLISLLLCAAVYGVARAGFSLWRLLLGAAVLVPAGIFVAGMIGRGFENDLISNGTSVATRATMTLFAALCVLHNPFGVGFAGSYPAMARYLPDAMETVGSLFSVPMVFTEVSNYQYAMENADCKTFFLDLVVSFGLPFAVIFFGFFARLFRRLYRGRQQILLIGALFAATALTTYYSAMNSYSIPVLLGLCVSVSAHEDPLRQRA